MVGDVHGHREKLVSSLHAAGLIDADEAWSGDDARVWFLGDFFDRGTDGIGVVDLVMRLVGEAEQSGGEVHALLGNHEILALGTHRFGDTDVPSGTGQRSFARSWLLNGGVEADQEALTEDHVAWLAARPALALVDDHLLMHSDTVEYFGWGTSIDQINGGLAEVLGSDDLAQWWECWRRLTTRFAFRSEQGNEVAAEVMKVLGGSRIVHGHSIIAEQLGVEPEAVTGPVLYAGGTVLGVDGGAFLGGPCLVVELPYEEH